MTSRISKREEFDIIFDRILFRIKLFQLVLLEPVVHFSCALIHLVSLSIHWKKRKIRQNQRPSTNYFLNTYLSFFSFSSLAFFNSSFASRSLWIRPISSCSFCSCSFAFILADETDSLETERGTAAKATCLAAAGAAEVLILPKEARCKILSSFSFSWSGRIRFYKEEDSYRGSIQKFDWYGFCLLFL